MLKAVLISLAALVTFDAVAWESRVREELVRELVFTIARVQALDWSWD